MRILITGVAGFIGYSLAKKLLEKKNYKIIGIDNLDNYYSIAYKKRRLNTIKKNKNFKFYKVDIKEFKNLSNKIKKHKFDIIFHFAAQAGVRYSNIFPTRYIDSNIHGFNNLYHALNKKTLRKFIYASSSSIYGEQNKFPLNETLKPQPKNLYGVSKKINEIMAEFFSMESKMQFIGLRFFTVYGKWGRPDMFIFKLFKAFFLKNFFYLNNYGNHDRDFTYIDDVTEIMERLMKKTIKNKHQIFNICSNNPINIKDTIKLFANNYGKIKIKNVEKNSLDVLKTHGNNKKIIKFLKNVKFSNFNENFKKTFMWYKNSKIYKFNN